MMKVMVVLMLNTRKEENVRNYILYRYICLGSPDPVECDDYLEEKGAISRIEDASCSKVQ